MLVPAEQVRDAVKAEIRAVTGLDPVLRGDMSVSLFPSGSVSFSDVALGDDKDGEPPLAAEQLTARLRFLPLLIGRIEVADVALVNPRMLLAIDADGRSNWAPLLASLGRAFEPGSGAARLVVLRNPHRRRHADDARRGAQDLSSACTKSRCRSPGRRSPRASPPPVASKWRGEPFDVGAHRSAISRAALSGERSGLKMRLAGAPLKFAFDGAMSQRPTLKMEGTVGADSPSLRRRDAPGLGATPPPGGGFERFSLKAQTNVVAGTIALTGVNLELDGNSAEGVLTFATEGRQTLQGTLAARRLDLTPYLSAIRLLTAASANGAALPLDLDGLSPLRSRPAAVGRPDRDRQRPSSAAPPSPPICAPASSPSRSANRRPSAA